MPIQKQLPTRIKSVDRDTFKTMYLFRDDSSKQAWIFFSNNTQGTHDNYTRFDVFPCAGVAMPPRYAKMMGISRLGAELGEAYGSKEISFINSLKEPTKKEEDLAMRICDGSDGVKYRPKQWRNSYKTYYSNDEAMMRSYEVEAYEGAQRDVEGESHLPEDRRLFPIKSVKPSEFFKEVDRLYYDAGYRFPLVESGLRAAKRKTAKAQKALERANVEIQ